MIKPTNPNRLVNIVWTVARKSSNRLKFCWLKVIRCISQSNELEGEIRQKTGGQTRGQPKTWGSHRVARWSVFHRPGQYFIANL